MSSENIIKIVDKNIGNLICLGLAPFSIFKNRILTNKWPKASKPIKVRKILVIMFWGIGSNIAVFPAIRKLKERFPKAKIDVLAPEKNKDLFYNNKYINKLHPIEAGVGSLIKNFLRLFGRYDLVFDYEHWLNISAILSFFSGKVVFGFSNKFRSILYSKKLRFDKDKHSVVNNLRLVQIVYGKKWDADNIKINKVGLEKVETKKEAKEYIERILISKNITDNTRLIAICPGSGSAVKYRRWPADKFALLADKILEKEKTTKIIFLGSKQERNLINYIQSHMGNQKRTINSSGITLGQLAALIDRCDMIISNDTGPMHLAAAQGINVIGLFGPEIPRIFGPYSSKSISIVKDIRCSPCIKIYDGKYENCKRKGECMKLISVREVFDCYKKITN